MAGCFTRGKNCVVGNHCSRLSIVSFPDGCSGQLLTSLNSPDLPFIIYSPPATSRAYLIWTPHHSSGLHPSPTQSSLNPILQQIKKPDSIHTSPTHLNCLLRFFVLGVAATTARCCFLNAQHSPVLCWLLLGFCRGGHGVMSVG